MSAVGAAIDAADSGYGYRPSVALNSVILALFIISLVASMAQTMLYRSWWIIPLIIGLMLEVGGYATRIYASSKHERLFEKDPLMAQLILIVIAPALFSAVNYAVLGFLVDCGGLASSTLGGRHGLFTIVFVTCDVISLMIQSVGGAMASITYDKGESPDPGTHTMVAGIAFQTVSMAIFMLLFVEYIIKYLGRSKDWRTTSWKVLVYTLLGSSVCIFARSVYRVVELAQGWNGSLITQETYFIVFDSVLMLMFAYSHIIVFPPKYLRELRRDDEKPHSDKVLVQK
jgi:RTA1 like protein